jgi:3-isopropylmalate/(R)-2-methylmalate dehydratase small subunit
MSGVDRITGRALPIRGDDIDTDRIIPARFLKAITFEGLEAHAFSDDRAEARRRGDTHPFDADAYRGARLLLVNANFGCGSSREHAPQALVRSGLRAVVGESFAEIFFGNAQALGMPCVTAAPADVQRLMDLVERDPRVELALDLHERCLEAGGTSVTIALPDEARAAFLSGAWDATGQLLDRYDQVERAIARLPYLHGFPSDV